MIEQSKHVHGGVIVAEGLRENSGAAMAGQGRQAELKFRSPLREGRNPILARTGEAVQQQERLAASVNFKVELLAVERLDAPRQMDKRHPCTSFGLIRVAKRKPPALSHGRLMNFFSLAQRRARSTDNRKGYNWSCELRVRKAILPKKRAFS